jgi:hypothetical protein
MVNLLTKIKHIIIGTINNILKQNSNVSNPRLKICKKCSDKIYIFRLGYICSHCGCLLKSKTTVSDEHCPLNKW